jgi:hypothetical protein
MQSPAHKVNRMLSSPASLLLLLLLLQVTCGETDAAAGEAALAAAYGSNGQRPRLLSVKGNDLGFALGEKVRLRGTWDRHDTYELSVKE